MKQNRMHIRPEDYISSLQDNIADNFLFTPPEGRPHLTNETSDYIVKENGHMYYHEHPHGYEIFVIDKGSVECYIDGKRTIAHTGDFVLVPPYVPHGFIYLEEGTIWRELFEGIDMYQIMLDQETIRNNFPEKAEDEDFMNKVRTDRGIIPLPEPENVVDVPKEAISFIKAKDDAIERYAFDGIDMYLKIARWEIDGIKEIWEYVLAKDVVLDWTEPHHQTNLMIVKSGSVRVEAGGEEFIAKERDIISIPNYTPQKMTVLEEGTVLHDYNCTGYLLRLLQELKASQDKDKSAIDAEFIRSLQAKHGCPIVTLTRK